MSCTGKPLLPTWGREPFLRGRE